MKKLIPLFLLVPSTVFADVTSSMMTTVQIQVNAAGTQVERLGGSYSASGTNVGTSNTGDQLGGFSVNSTTNAVTLDVGDVNNFGSVISTEAGSGTGFDVTIGSDHTITDLDAGGSGSVTTGSFVTSVTTN